MTPATMAMATLIVIGGFTIVTMIVWMYRKDGPTIKSIIVIVLGFAMIGVGGFGPKFLNDYGSFVSSLQLVGSTYGDAQQQAAQDVVQKYAQGKYPEEDWPIIEATLRQYAVPNLDQILLEAEQEVTTPTRRQAIELTRQDLERESISLDTLREIDNPRLDDEPVAELDQETVLKRLDNRTIRLLIEHPELEERWRIDGIETERLHDELRRRRTPIREQP